MPLDGAVGTFRSTVVPLIFISDRLGAVQNSSSHSNSFPRPRTPLIVRSLDIDRRTGDDHPQARTEHHWRLIPLVQQHQVNAPMPMHFTSAPVVSFHAPLWLTMPSGT